MPLLALQPLYRPGRVAPMARNSHRAATVAPLCAGLGDEMMSEFPTACPACGAGVNGVTVRSVVTQSGRVVVHCDECGASTTVRDADGSIPARDDGYVFSGIDDDGDMIDLRRVSDGSTWLTVSGEDGHRSVILSPVMAAAVARVLTGAASYGPGSGAVCDMCARGDSTVPLLMAENGRVFCTACAEPAAVAPDTAARVHNTVTFLDSDDGVSTVSVPCALGDDHGSPFDVVRSIHARYGHLAHRTASGGVFYTVTGDDCPDGGMRVLIDAHGRTRPSI